MSEVLINVKDQFKSKISEKEKKELSVLNSEFDKRIKDQKDVDKRNFDSFWEYYQNKYKNSVLESSRLETDNLKSTILVEVSVSADKLPKSGAELTTKFEQKIKIIEQTLKTIDLKNPDQSKLETIKKLISSAESLVTYGSKSFKKTVNIKNLTDQLEKSKINYFNCTLTFNINASLLAIASYTDKEEILGSLGLLLSNDNIPFLTNDQITFIYEKIFLGNFNKKDVLLDDFFRFQDLVDRYTNKKQGFYKRNTDVSQKVKENVNGFVDEVWNYATLSGGEHLDIANADGTKNIRDEVKEKKYLEKQNKYNQSYKLYSNSPSVSSGKSLEGNVDKLSVKVAETISAILIAKLQNAKNGAERYESKDEIKKFLTVIEKKSIQGKDEIATGLMNVILLDNSANFTSNFSVIDPTIEKDKNLTINQYLTSYTEKDKIPQLGFALGFSAKELFSLKISDLNLSQKLGIISMKQVISQKVSDQEFGDKLVEKTLENFEKYFDNLEVNTDNLPNIDKNIIQKCEQIAGNKYNKTKETEENKLQEAGFGSFIGKFLIKEGQNVFKAKPGWFKSFSSGIKKIHLTGTDRGVLQDVLKNGGGEIFVKTGNLGKNLGKSGLKLVRSLAKLPFKISAVYGFALGFLAGGGYVFYKSLNSETYRDFLKMYRSIMGADKKKEYIEDLERNIVAEKNKEQFVIIGASKSVKIKNRHFGKGGDSVWFDELKTNIYGMVDLGQGFETKISFEGNTMHYDIIVNEPQLLIGNTKVGPMRYDANISTTVLNRLLRRFSGEDIRREGDTAFKDAISSFEEVAVEKAEKSNIDEFTKKSLVNKFKLLYDHFIQECKNKGYCDDVVISVDFKENDSQQKVIRSLDNEINNIDGKTSEEKGKRYDDMKKTKKIIKK